MGNAVERKRECRLSLGWPALVGLVTFFLFLTATNTGRSQPSTDDVTSRLRRLHRLSQEEIGKECESLLRAIDETGINNPQRRAIDLDSLRDACRQELTWTDPILLRIAERAVARRRPL